MLAACAAALASGCGGDDRQDSDEPTGTYDVRVVRASFPPQQKLAQQSALAVTVRNADQRRVPNVTLTIGRQGGVNEFSADVEQRGLASRPRAIWIVDDSPKGGATAYVNTYALGPLAPNQERTFRFLVTATRPGTFDVDYRVSAGLDGKAKARGPGGAQPAGSFRVTIAGDPDAAPAPTEPQQPRQGSRGGSSPGEAPNAVDPTANG